MNLPTLPIPVLLLLAVRLTSGANVARMQDAARLPKGEARIQGEVVHDEDSAPVRSFRIHLRGERMEGTETDGWEYPGKKGGWICTPLHRGGWGEDGPEDTVEEEPFLAIGDWKSAPDEYRFDRAVRGGEGRFEWVVAASGCDLARGFVTLEKGRASDLGEVRLRRGSAAIEGHVVDAIGRPVAEASIRLTGLLRPKSGVLGWANRIRTDEMGFYRFDRVPAGKGYVHVQPGPVAAMPPIPLTVQPGSTNRVDFRPEVGTLRVAVEVGEGEGWTRPFKLCLQSVKGRTFVRWPVFPTHLAPGSILGRSVFSGGVACGRRPEAIELRAVRIDEPPGWEPRPPTVSGDGSGNDVAIGADGKSFRIANVPAGEWRVSLRAVERNRPAREGEEVSGVWPGSERWEVPPLRPSPEIVEVRAGEETSLTLLAK
ncbi:MAG: carboxypeptidase-like regulatory domain-containing protein [Planctomycetes bacterium]|nr:carboxypeptidase-like regulatory domain-containing protein [Planctomycetota bacterium]